MGEVVLSPGSEPREWAGLEMEVRPNPKPRSRSETRWERPRFSVEAKEAAQGWAVSGRKATRVPLEDCHGVSPGLTSGAIKAVLVMHDVCETCPPRLSVPLN